MAGSQGALEIRALSTRKEFEDAVQLQRQIWGFDDIELLPVRLFVVANKVGGHSFGAYDGNRMVGFCLAIPGLKPGGLYYLHSHMLGVLPEYHNRGIGRMLKFTQREDALQRGIRLVEWTFDPLEIKNAYFNIERLGAIVRRYVENQYGTTSSPLHGGLPTDRCIAEWWVDSKRVEQFLAGKPGRRLFQEAIEVPADVAAIRKEDSRLARDIQKSVAQQFQSYFERGLAVTGFERSADKASYLLGSWEEE